MSCYNPKFGYLEVCGFKEDGSPKQKMVFVNREYKNRANEANKTAPAFFFADGSLIEPFSIPCGMCAGCRNDHAREWAARCVCESMLYPAETCHFLTLTYNDEHLPHGTKDIASTDIDEVRHFVDLLRKKFRDRYNHTGLRYFAATEYGDKHSRPHAHLLLFNAPFPDGDFERIGNNFRGDVYFVSSMIDEIWRDEFGESKGFHTIAELNIDTAAYTARYAMKKLKGHSSQFYMNAGIEPEAQSCSLRPGIGAAYALANQGKIYTLDEFVNYDYNKGRYYLRNVRDKLILPNGIEQKPPRYFDKLYARQSDATAYNMALIKQVREQNGELALLGKLARCNYTEEQLLHIEAREQNNAFKKLVRGFEKGIL